MSAMIKNRNRRRREQTRPTLVVVGGIATTIMLGIVLGVGLRTPGGAPGVNYRTLYATVPDIGNLRKHQEVRLAGVRVGQVVDATPAGDQVRLRLQLNPGTSPLPTDTTVRVRAAGLLGARYVELRPGRAAQTLGDGAQLAAARDTLSSGVSDALETFDAETRGGLRASIDGLGNGLAGRGQQINEMLDGGATAAQNFEGAINAVLARPGAARRLVPSLEGAAAALDGARDDFAEALPPTAVTLRAFEDRRKPLSEALDLAAPALDAARPAFVEGQPLLRATAALARSASRTLPPAPAALRAVTATLRDSGVPLRRAAHLLKDLEPAVPAALKLTRSLDPVLTPLAETLGDLVEPVQRIGRHACDLRNLSENWRSVLGWGTSGGTAFGPYNTFRIEAVAGPSSVSQYGQGLVKVPGALIDRNPYPGPCVEDGGTYDVVDVTDVLGRRR